MTWLPLTAIGPVDLQPSQEIRVLLVLRMRPAGSRLLVYSNKAHFSHQPFYSPPAHRVTKVPQMTPHLSSPVEWRFKKLAVNTIDQVNTVKFSADGSILYSGGGDGVIRIVNVNNKKRQACCNQWDRRM